MLAPQAARHPRARRVAAAGALVLLLPLASCVRPSDPAEATLHPVPGPDAGWLSERYASGLGEPRVVAEAGEAFCGLGPDAATAIVRLPAGDGTPGASGVVGKDVATGERTWFLPDRSCVRGSVVDGVLYLGPSDWLPGRAGAATDEYVAVDADTGRPQQVIQRGDSNPAWRVIARDGAAVYAWTGRAVAAYADGRERWLTPTPTEDCVLIPTSGHLGCSAADARTYTVLDAASGRVTASATSEGGGRTGHAQWFTDGFAIGPGPYAPGDVTYFDFAGTEVRTASDTARLPDFPRGAFYPSADAVERSPILAVGERGQVLAATGERGDLVLYPARATTGPAQPAPTVYTTASGSAYLIGDGAGLDLRDAAGAPIGRVADDGGSTAVTGGVLVVDTGLGDASTVTVVPPKA